MPPQSMPGILEAQAKESPKTRSGLQGFTRGNRHDQEEEEREGSDKQSWVADVPDGCALWF
jgi:hypothetical protein